MEFFRFLIVFLLGGFLGFLIELFFRRFVSYKKWVKPGFLVGPIVPLYAFGLLFLFVSCRYEPFSSLGLPSWMGNLILSIALGILVSLIEMVTGLFFLKAFHTRLWDYSGEKGNFKGVICPRFSLAWTLLCAAYVFLLHGPISSFADILLCFDPASSSYGVYSLATIFALGLLYGFLLIDVFYSFSLIGKLKKAAEKRVVDFEKLKSEMSEAKRKRKEAFAFFFPFVSHGAFEARIEEGKKRLALNAEIAAHSLKLSKESRAQIKMMNKEKRKRK